MFIAKTELQPIKRLVAVCGEGIGRSVLTHAALLALGMARDYPEIEFAHAGLGPPKSGRKCMHPEVISVSSRRFNVDIREWLWYLLHPDMVDDSTLVVGLTDQPIPDIARKGRGFLHANIFDPAGDNLTNALEVTASQVFNIAWIIGRALATRADEIGVERDASGLVRPQYLMQFQPRGIDPEYELSGFTFAGQVPSSLLRGLAS